jgi:hypothetical protein
MGVIKTRKFEAFYYHPPAPLPQETRSPLCVVIASDPAMAGERGNLIEFKLF